MCCVMLYDVCGCLFSLRLNCVCASVFCNDCVYVCVCGSFVLFCVTVVCVFVYLVAVRVYVLNMCVVCDVLRDVVGVVCVFVVPVRVFQCVCVCCL